MAGEFSSKPRLPFHGIGKVGHRNVIYCGCVLSHVQFCNPMVCNPPGSSVHGIFQARLLEWVAISSSRGSSQARGQTSISCISCIGRRIVYQLHHLGSPRVKEPYVAAHLCTWCLLCPLFSPSSIHPC